MSDIRQFSGSYYIRRNRIIKKVVLGVACFLAIMTIFGAHIFKSNGKKIVPMFSMDAYRERKAIISPEYVGKNKKEQPYILRAEHAEQITPESVTLSHPEASLKSQQKRQFLLRSETGVLKDNNEKLSLQKNVILEDQEGSTFRSKSALVNLKQGKTIGHDPVKGKSTRGHITSEGFALDENVVTFTGKSRLVINKGGSPK